MKYEAFIIHVEISSLVKLEQAIRQGLAKHGALGTVEYVEMLNLANEIRSRLQHIQNGYKPSGDFDPTGVESMFTQEALKLSDVGVLEAALSYRISRMQELRTPPSEVGYEGWLA